MDDIPMVDFGEGARLARTAKPLTIHEMEFQIIAQMRAGDFGNVDLVEFSAGRIGNDFQVLFRDRATLRWSIANFDRSDGELLSHWMPCHSGDNQ